VLIFTPFPVLYLAAGCHSHIVVPNDAMLLAILCLFLVVLSFVFFIPGTPTHQKPFNAPHVEHRVHPQRVPRFVVNAMPVNSCGIKCVPTARPVGPACMEKKIAPSAA
jgi:hypothetical protein